MASDGEEMSVHSDDSEEIVGFDGLEIDGAAADKEALLMAFQWIGIDDEADRQKVSTEMAETLEDFKDMTQKEVEEAILAMTKAKQAGNRVLMSAKVRKRLGSLVHWVQDFYRCSQKPTLDDVTSPAKLLHLLEEASERAGIRQHRSKNSATLAEQTDPGALKGNTLWSTWLEAQENHLSCTFGVKGTPLSYLTRKEDVGDPEAHYDSFDEMCIACAPLSGPAFEADAATLHQKMISWTQGHDSFQFIKKNKKMNNGRADHQLLAKHYNGAGNLEVRLKRAKMLKETVHYKNEKILKFDSFLHKIEEMVNIFEEVGQPMFPDAKLTFLLDKVQCPEMSADISTLRAQKVQGNCDYTFAADFLGGRAASTTSHAGNGRTIAKVVAMTRNKGEHPKTGCHTLDGYVFTGKYAAPYWYALTAEQKQTVNDCRVNDRAPNKKYGLAKDYARGTRSVKAVKAKKTKEKGGIAALTRDIAAIKRTVSQLVAVKEGGAVEEDEPNDQAGTRFGGKNEKKRNKTNSD